MFSDKLFEVGTAVKDLDLFLFKAPAFLPVYEARIAAQGAFGADGEIVLGKAVRDEQLSFFFFFSG